MKAVEKTEEKAIEVCPLCGSKLEKGYVASVAAAWSKKKISTWSLRGLFSGEIIIGTGLGVSIHNVEAYRCKKCKLVIFRYEVKSRKRTKGKE